MKLQHIHEWNSAAIYETMRFAEIPATPEDVSLLIDFDRCYYWLGSIDRDKKYKYTTITSEIVLPKALDGGYGWVVVMGAFSVTFICGGVFASFGVLYSELLAHYNESKSKTSFVGSVFFGFSMLLGPVTSILTKRYGSRTITIAGGLVSSLGMFLSMFAPTINVLIMTFGLLVGAGFSCCFIAGVDIVSLYFEKKISLATGIAISGSGFGTVTFAPLMEYVIGELNLAGLFLIMSGVCLNLIVCGMLFEPLKLTKKETRIVNLGNFVKLPKNRADIEMPENTFRASAGVSEHEDETMSLFCVPTFVPEHLKRYSSVVLMKALQKGRNDDVTLHRYMTNAVLQVNYIREFKLKGSSVDRNSAIFLSANNSVSDEGDPQNRTMSKDKQTLINPKELTRNSVLSTDSVGILKTSFLLTQLPLYRRDIFFRCHDLKSCIFGTSCPELNLTKKTQVKKKATLGLGHFLKLLFDFSNFYSMFMIIFLLSNFMFYFWIDVPYMYAPDYAVGVGIERSDAVYIISLMGVAVTSGQIVFGILGDTKVDVLHVFATSTALSGLLVCFIPMTYSILTMVICFIPLGFCMSANCSLKFALLAEHVGLSKMTQAYGILMLSQGMANFMGPIVSGWIADITGNYDFTFYTCGCFFTLAGLVLYIPRRQSIPINMDVNISFEVTPESSSNDFFYESHE